MLYYLENSNKELELGNKRDDSSLFISDNSLPEFEEVVQRLNATTVSMRMHLTTYRYDVVILY